MHDVVHGSLCRSGLLRSKHRWRGHRRVGFR
jgi:hypothetical protein